MIQAGYSDERPVAAKESAPSSGNGERNNYSMNARKISNGWLVKECWEEGKDRKYQEVETYHTENPIDKD